MKYAIIVLMTVLCAVGLLSMNNAPPGYAEQSVVTFKNNAAGFAASADALRQAVNNIQAGDDRSVAEAKEALANCRLQYKRIEFFMEYFFKYPVNMYNRAPVYEVEEPFMEYQSPIGLQVIEDLLMDTAVFSNKKELIDQCDVVYASAKDIPSILYGFTATDAQLLEAVRLELVRIITLGITGYDAPLLRTGINESAIAMTAIKDNLQPLLSRYDNGSAYSVRRYLDSAINMLLANTDFNSFDRLTFLTHAALPLQGHFRDFVSGLAMESNTVPALSSSAPHIFSRDAIAIHTFADNVEEGDIDTRIALGKSLFYEKALSGNNSRSCATCHQPGKYFTDGLVKSKTIDGKSVLRRNAPTLLYTAYQHIQFHDGRAASLEEQLVLVLQNPLEMNADTAKVVAYLNEDAHYNKLFKQAFKHLDKITLSHVAAALVAYEQTLAPFNSPFDKYIAGDTYAMTQQQQKGFNLFMGKAQCGTCHFAPVFNGLLPPYYDVSELEVLGVPQNRSKRKAIADADSGRYHFFPISFNNGAFKTTTVRNAANTAPYMHNGVFKNLKEVISFYNDGGGTGRGLDIETQTLSGRPLKLTKKEQAELTAFIEALSDDIGHLK